MRCLGLDIGAVRIGVAVSDPRGRVATPVETVAATPRSAALARIAALAADRGVDQVVVGLPLELDGREGAAVRKVRALTSALATLLPCPIVEWDERLTSVAAERSLIASDVRRSARKQAIDQVAAVLILQGYLDWCRRDEGRDEERDA